MQALKKQFANYSHFPFHLVYQDTKSPQHELPDHMHDWYEIVYVYSGQGTIFINHTFYEMNAGDVFLIPGNTVHRALPDEHSPVTSSAIFFAPSLIQPMEPGDSYSLLRCFDQARKRKAYKLDLSMTAKNTLAEWIDAMNDEWNNQLPNYRVAILIRLYDVLLSLNRIGFPKIDNEQKSHLEPAWLREILQYIDDHTGSSISMADLSARAAVTYSHFSRVFKQFTGMNVTEYILAKKMMLAKELLLRTDHTISAICIQCGFESESYFYKKFKMKAGMTPTDYKRIHQV